jgi:hypothetical protein
MTGNVDLGSFSAARSFEAAARHYSLLTASAGEHILIEGKQALFYNSLFDLHGHGRT